jgi:hypothetical protein
MINKNNCLALQPAMTHRSSYLHNMVGKVIELHFPFKAVVSFNYKGKQERALLKAEKLIVDCQKTVLVCSEPYRHLCSRNVKSAFCNSGRCFQYACQ